MPRAILRVFEGDEMSQVRRVVMIVTALVAMASAAETFAKGKADKPDKPKANASAVGTSGKAEPSAGEPVNACGCYRDAKGACVCTDKKAKCECPGDCEPVGCDQKREKEMEREMAAEVKRAQDDEKRRKEAQEADERSTAADAGIVPAPDETPAPKMVKPARKAPAKAAKK